MSFVRRFALVLVFVLASLGIAQSFMVAAQAQVYPPALLSGLHWRDVGPMRAGRSYAVAGVISQPDTFYMGSVGGGVWKTINAGRTWFPIGDEGIPMG